MRFARFAEHVETIENTSGNEMQSAVADLFTEADVDALAIVPRFVQGEIFPADDERKTGVGAALLQETVATVTGETEDDIDALLPTVSDMGALFDQLAIEATTGQQRIGSSHVTVSDVYQMLVDVASTSGAGSQQRKIDTISGVLAQVSQREAKYVTRLLLGKMRVGVGSGVVRNAIGEAFDIDADRVERALMLSNDAGDIAVIASESGESGLRNTVEIDVCGSPVEPMNAQKTELASAFEDLGSETALTQTKYDGARIQIHKDGDTVRTFTRSLEDVTASVPDVVERVTGSVQAETAIVDAEVVGYESTDTDEPLRFQEVLKRLRRKYDVEEKAEEISLDIHAFDVLYTGESGLLIDESQQTRWETLKRITASEIRATTVLAETREDIQQLNAAALEAGHEGVMIKHPDASYEPNKRGKKWLKVKPEGDTIDAVVTEGTWGKGDREGFISSYLLAIRDGTGELQTVGKMGTGLTDADMETLTEHFEDRITNQAGRQVEFTADTIVEVEFEEVQPSPTYTSGFALRFPRFVARRDTLTMGDVDTVTQLKQLGDISSEDG